MPELTATNDLLPASQIEYTKLVTLIQNTPLLEAESSENGLAPDLFVADRRDGGTLYYGTGLCTAKAMSTGVPFDVIGMFSIAEKLRRRLGLKKVIQLIADTHAKSNSFANPSEVATLAHRVKSTMLKLAESVNATDFFTAILSSEFDETPQYQEIFQGITSTDHEYVRREWADIEYLRRYYGLAIKLSWTIGAKAKKIGYDERLFDQRYTLVTGHPMSFVYLLPGRTFDRERQKVSPYISVPGEERILIRPGENVERKLEQAERESGTDVFRSTRNHLENVVAQFEEVFGSLDASSTLAQKIELIINKGL